MKDNKSILNRKLGELAGAVMFVALVCLTTMLSSQNASAASNPREKYMVLGTIENIDSAANTITVRLFDGTDKSMQLSKRLMVNGRAEKRTRAESRLMPQERAVIYYADKGSMTLVIRTARGKDETFRVQSDAVIETGDSVMTFTQFEANPGTQIVLHYQDPLGMTEVRRVKR